MYSARRWWTREAAGRIGSETLEDKETEVPASNLHDAVAKICGRRLVDRLVDTLYDRLTD